MIRVNLLEYEPLSSSLDYLISGTLPHENYEAEYFSSIIQNIFKLIRLEEMSMEYYVLFSALTQLKKIGSSIPEFKPHLSKEVLDTVLVSSLFDLIRRPEVRITRYLDSQGLPSDLNNELALEKAAQVLYERTMDLYDRCFEKAVPSSQALSGFSAFKEAYIRHVADEFLQVQREILEDGVRIGRVRYIGPEGWREYSRYFHSQLSMRLDAVEDNTIHVKDIETGNELMLELTKLFEPLSEYNIRPLDNSVAIYKHRLVTIAGNEGIGKTSFSCYLAALLISKGKRVLYMHGESPKGLAYVRILCAYIRITTNKFITPDHITGKLGMSEEIEKLVRRVRLELDTSGNLILEKSFNYYTIYDELVSLYEEYKFDAVFIDHSKTLSGGRKEKEDIDALAIALRTFKVKYPVYICVLSHLSVIAKEMLQRGKKVTSSPTRGSTTLSGESDEVFILNRTEELKRQSLIALDVYKIRGSDVTDIILLKFFPECCYIEFDPRDQGAYEKNLVGAEAALEDIKETYGDEEDDDLYLD